MSFVVATATITDFAAGLFTGTLDVAFDIIDIVWPYVLTIALVFAVVRYAKGVLGVFR